MTCPVCLLGFCLAPWAAAGQSYARPELLVEPAQLAAAKSFLVIDVRAQKDYDEGHIPGTLRVDHDAWKNAFGSGRDAKDWSKRIGAMGIKADSTVVTYDDKNSNEAARIWWILRYWGVKDVRLLNGGWQGWKAARLPVDSAPAKAAASQFVATPHADRLATKQQILQRLKSGQWQLVDSRSSGEYCGLQSKAKKAGAIPGTKHLDWVDLIDKPSHRFKTAAEISRLFERAGIDLARPSTSYCQSGGRASVMVFAMELMGANQVRNYYGSWHEWGNADDTPVVKPTPKKS